MKEVPKCWSCEFVSILLLYDRTDIDCGFVENILKKVEGKDKRTSPKWCPLRNS